MSRKRIPMEEEFADDSATLEWLKSQKESTKKVYKSLWRWFLEFTAMSGEQILADRKQDEEHRWEKKVLEFREWCLNHTCEYHEKPLGEGGIKTATGVIRGYKLAKETIARMSVQANLRDRYVLVVGKSLGLRAIDFINLKVGDFTCLDLDSEPPISMGKMHTVKESVSAFPLLDSDSVPIVKAHLKSIGITDPNRRMLQIKKGELTRILQDLAEKGKINVGNKHLRFHCLRKFLIDRLSAVMSESKWKQVVGKKISEDAYISEEQLREAYGRAMAETTFSNHNHRIMKVAQLETTIEVLSQKITEQTDEIAQLGGRLAERDVELSKLEQELREAKQETSHRFARIEKFLKIEEE